MPTSTVNLGRVKGDAATITVGNVTMGESGSNPIISARVTPGGTSGDKTLDFTIPMGPVGPQPSITIVNDSTNSITLSNQNNNAIIRCTATNSVLVTVPSTLATGFSCMVIQAGTGQITFVQGSGATLNSFGNLFTTAGQHAPASIIHVGAGVYNLSGNLV